MRRASKLRADTNEAQVELVEYCQGHGIQAWQWRFTKVYVGPALRRPGALKPCQVTAYSPLAAGHLNLMQACGRVTVHG